MAIKCQMLGWERPVLEVATERLLAQSESTAPVDLGHVLVLVPTAESGRKLRYHLAFASENGVLAPKVMTPELLWEQALPVNFASKLVRLAAWREVLKSPGCTQAVTGEEGVLEGFRLQQLARQYDLLREELADGGDCFYQEKGHFKQEQSAKEGADDETRPKRELGLSFAKVAETLAEEDPRFQVLADLEQEYLACLQSWKKVDPYVQQLQWPQQWNDIKKIVLLALADPMPRSFALLAEAEKRGIVIETWVAAPLSMRDWFDVWGRPVVQKWKQRTLPLDQVEVLAVPDETALAKQICKHLCQWQVASNEVALHVCDGAYSGVVAAELSQAGWQCYDPKGQQAGVVAAKPALQFFLRYLQGSIEGMLEWLAIFGLEKCIPSLQQRSVDKIAVIVEMWTKWLPLDADSLYSLCATELQKVRSYQGKLEVVVALEWFLLVLEELKKWRQDFLGNSLLVAPKIEILLDDLSAVDDGAEGAWWNSLAETVVEIAYLEQTGVQFSLTEALELCLASMKATALVESKDLAAIDLAGWLEVGFTSEPYLLLAGFHEGIVPAAPLDSPLMHDGIREQLGLRGRDWRFALDCFCLEQVLSSRAPQKVAIFLAESAAGGETRLPSRLLFQREADKLATSVFQLLTEKDSSLQNQTLPAWERGSAKLALGEALEDSLPWRRGLSPSKINRYLQCPLRFALEHVWGMQKFEWKEKEMSARHFGNLAHQVLEDFGRDENLRKSQDAAEIEAYLQDRLNWRARQMLGKKRSVLVELQLASLVERLAGFAQWQALWCQEGWEIYHVEKRLGTAGSEWKIAGTEIFLTGIVDRIDYHPQRDEWMIWDYKTRSNAKGKKENLATNACGELEKSIHLANANQEVEARGEYASSPFMLGKKEFVWQDLQLPLYALHWQDLQKCSMPRIGQIVLGATKSAVAGYEWKDWSGEGAEEIHQSAENWAKAAVKRIVEGVFWPEGPHWKYKGDEFDLLAKDGWENAFTAESLELLQGKCTNGGTESNELQL